jgi:hypothetical protein
MRTSRWIHSLGLDPWKLGISLRSLPSFFKNKRTFRQLQESLDPGAAFKMAANYPCLHDRYHSAGTASGHYFHQDLYMAQLINEAKPSRHVDIGSRIDGFVAHVASFCMVEVHDIRPAETSARNIRFVQRDIMAEDPTFNEYTDSLSCLHALEHLGLGRYGDSLDYEGYRKGWNSLTRMVAKGGVFYFSVPIGYEQRIEFNAHRIFSLPFLLREMILPSFEVQSFSFVNDCGDIQTNVDLREASAERTFDLSYGCGLFELKKM